MKKLALTLALAFTVFGGAVAISAVSCTHLAACPNNNC
jgi:hypothetical protein